MKKRKKKPKITTDWKALHSGVTFVPSALDAHEIFETVEKAWKGAATAPRARGLHNDQPYPWPRH